MECNISKEIVTLDDNRDYLSFLYFTDDHHSSSSPENRLDNLNETSLLKLREVMNIAKKREVDFILNGGDFFDKPDTTDSLAGKIAEILKNNKIPLFIVPGGHDIFGNNINTLYRTKLGLFEKSGFCKLLIHPNINEVIIKNNKLSIQLTGTASHFGIDYENIENDYILKRKESNFAVHCIHGMLAPKPFIPNTPTVAINEILETKADITLGAHNHLGFDVVNKDNKYFANPGALVRKSNDLKEMDRKPKVYIITVSKTKGITFENIYLKAAKKGTEVLSREKIEKQKAVQVTKSDFVQKIKKSQKMKVIKLDDIIQRICKNRKLPKSVIEIALEKLSLAREKLGERDEIPFIEKGSKNVVNIELFNFQGYEHEIIEIKDGITVFIGPSNKGKTTIFRALKWVLFNEPRGNNFINWDAEYAKVIITLSDGNIITRERRSKKNIYVLERPDGSEEKSENFGINVPDFIKEATSLYKVKIDNDYSLILNIMQQLEAPFLFSQTSSIKEKIIGSVARTNTVDLAEKYVNKDIFSNNTDIKYLDKEIEKENKELIKYEDINEETIMLENVEAILNDIKELDTKLRRIIILKNNLSKVSQEISITENRLKKLDDISIIEQKYAISKEKLFNLKALNNLREKKNSNMILISDNIEILSKIKNIDKIDENKLIQSLLKIKKLYLIRHNLINSKEEIGKQSSILKELKNLPNIDKKIDLSILKLKDFKTIYEIYQNKLLLNKENIQTELENKAKFKSLYIIEDKINQMEVNIERIKKIKAMNEKYNLISKDISIQDDFINKNIDKLFALFEKINNTNLELGNLYVLQNKLLDNKNRLEKGKIFINNTKKTLEKLAIVYTDLLAEEGTCPICNHKIEKKELELIIKNIKEDL